MLDGVEIMGLRYELAKGKMVRSEVHPALNEPPNHQSEGEFHTYQTLLTNYSRLSVIQQSLNSYLSL